jgi:hypothetical protein
MFETHSFTKEKYNIHYIVNYSNLNKENIDEFHLNLLNNCDIFMYQPLNQHYTESEYNISNIKSYLKEDTIILKVNYYRFRGFWYNSEHKPYSNYNNYYFNDIPYYGLHNSFIDFNSTNKNDIIDKINNINITKEEIDIFFQNELSKFSILDNNSDVKMLDYFKNNYKNKLLFHDPFHHTNLFFYEIFRQIIFILDNYELEYEDFDFINSLNHIEMTNWSLPILPIIKLHLELNLNDYIFLFYSDQKIYINIYDYYYIRLSHENFQNYLDNKNVL